MSTNEMIQKLATIAGLSTLELKGFYDTVREKGFANMDELEWLRRLTLPVDITFQVLRKPIQAPVSFEDVNEVLFKMYEARVTAEKSMVGDDPDDITAPDTFRNFVIYYVVCLDGKIAKFGDAAAILDMYPNRYQLSMKIADDERCHPSHIGVLNIVELSRADMESYLRTK